MVEPKLTSCEKQVEDFWSHASEAEQASFCEPRESFNPIDVSTAFDKCIVAMCLKL